MSDYQEEDKSYEPVEGEVIPGSPEDEFVEAHRLGDVLAHYRHRAGLSQADLSREADVDESNISFIETGRTPRPWPSTLSRLAAALSRRIPGLTAEQILLHFMEARDHKTSEYQILPETVAIDDALRTLDARRCRIAVELIHQVLQAIEKTRGL